MLADTDTKDAILIDPVLEMVDRDLTLIDELGFNLIFVVNTHAHADHVTGTGELKRRCSGVRSIISAASGADADIKLAPGDKISFGSRHLVARATPGHTAGCMTFVTDDESCCFTGDALLIRGCGRTDFQGGSAATLFESVHSQIFTLPQTCRVCPAHDYKGRTESTVGEEMKYNPRLTKDKPSFIDLMDNLGLAYPKRIDVALPRNMCCDYVGENEGQGKL